MLAERAGDLAQAESAYAQSLEIQTALGNRRSAALLHHDLGILSAYRGSYAEAIDQITESVTIYRQLGDARSIASALSDLGSIQMLGGDLATARKQLGESLALFRTLDDDHAIAAVSTNLGRAHQLAGDSAAAHMVLTEALERNREIGASDSEALALYSLGMLAMRSDDVEDAVALLQEALQVAQDASELWLVAEILEGLAQAVFLRGHLDLAIRLSGKAEAMRDESGSEKPASEQESYEALLARVRQEAGPQRFAQEQATGADSPVQSLLDAVMRSQSLPTA
jgi:tetratricopeptide (TPR) repeat protein